MGGEKVEDLALVVVDLRNTNNGCVEDKSNRKKKRTHAIQSTPAYQANHATKAGET
jgi:hypothetical protein|tara:strand:+ start:175 stop:342 length:168 start_codon:yes stop_codon:yes gene_type:complete